MSTTDHEGLWQRARAWIERRRRIHQLMQDFESFTAYERDAALHELGLNEEDLPRLAAGHMSTGYLDRMLEQTGLSPQSMRHDEPELWAAMERNCAMCPDWRTCAKDLEAQPARDEAPGYCENKAEIDALSRVERARASA